MPMRRTEKSTVGVNVQSADVRNSGDVINKPAHYTKGIECWDYIVSHNLSYLEGNVVKYITRYKHKNGTEDLLKARAYLNKLIAEQTKGNIEAAKETRKGFKLSEL